MDLDEAVEDVSTRYAIWLHFDKMDEPGGGGGRGFKIGVPFDSGLGLELDGPGESGSAQGGCVGCPVTPPFEEFDSTLTTPGCQMAAAEVGHLSTRLSWTALRELEWVEVMLS